MEAGAGGAARRSSPQLSVSYRRGSKREERCRRERAEAGSGSGQCGREVAGAEPAGYAARNAASRRRVPEPEDVAGSRQVAPAVLPPVNSKLRCVTGGKTAGATRWTGQEACPTIALAIVGNPR